MNERIPVSRLRPVRILYDGDLYEVARVVLQANAALGADKPYEKYPTVNGLAKSYAALLGVESRLFVDSAREQGLPLGAAVWDDGRG
ncbi:MAG: hypothetical protein O2782_17755 [bacterium]|nr:hypothetical protein [bacterium]